MLSLVPPPPPEPSSPAAGESLGPWVLEALLGEGTMGRVYRARHEKLGRPVALKVLHARHLEDKALVARFLQEARLVNQISHPHIVEVHDFVEEPARVYCVMELLEGQTLAARVAQGPLAVEEIRAVGTQIADALHAAHRVGVVHRDLKPDNVFLAHRVKVLDFGVAKLLQGSGDLRIVETHQGTLVGTPRYMAPEQVAGLEVDARTDVYALGTMLYELLAGRPPFDATAFGQLASDLITKLPPPLPTRTPAGEPIPPRLKTLVMACLAKQPAQRPATMDVVSTTLAHALEPRSAWVGPALAAAGLVLLAGIGWTFRAGDRPEPRPPPAQTRAPAALAPPPAPPPEPPAEAKVPEVSLSLTTTPPRAAVTRVDTGQALGVTPLTLSFPRDATRLRLRFELPGHTRLEREVSLQVDQSIELSLQPVQGRPTPRPVKDGVLDPY
jgi:serine/threonine-protein kinase